MGGLGLLVSGFVVLTMQEMQILQVKHLKHSGHESNAVML